MGRAGRWPRLASASCLAWHIRHDRPDRAAAGVLERPRRAPGRQLILLRAQRRGGASRARDAASTCFTTGIRTYVAAALLLQCNVQAAFAWQHGRLGLGCRPCRRAARAAVGAASHGRVPGILSNWDLPLPRWHSVVMGIAACRRCIQRLCNAASDCRCIAFDAPQTVRPSRSPGTPSRRSVWMLS